MIRRPSRGKWRALRDGDREDDVLPPGGVEVQGEQADIGGQPGADPVAPARPTLGDVRLARGGQLAEAGAERRVTRPGALAEADGARGEAAVLLDEAGLPLEGKSRSRLERSGAGRAAVSIGGPVSWNARADLRHRRPPKRANGWTPSAHLAP